MQTKAIIFDLYNTLIYTSVKRKPYLDLFRQLGLTKEEMSYWINQVMIKNYSYLQEIVEEIKPGQFVYTQQFERDIQEEIESTHVFEDTYSVLESLSKKYKLYLLSNISTPYKECFYNLKLDRWIDNPFFSCDIGYRKPQPEAFDVIIKHSGLHPKQILMIGDSQRSDYEGALNCGIKSILRDKPLSIILSEIN
jgi:putative hydrolase of the HAD superfamily